MVAKWIHHSPTPWSVISLTSYQIGALGTLTGSKINGGLTEYWNPTKVQLHHGLPFQ